MSDLYKSVHTQVVDTWLMTSGKFGSGRYPFSGSLMVCVLDYCSCLQNNEVFNKSVEALLASEGEILVCAFIMGFLAFNYHNGLQGKKI
ncbi:uncharacterized protein LOC126188797 [Schistocerca cancellata]|uniref:uncharacterized protein LOC126188797 n=1 Tax=Schistocerca cancellata TaxID=274614 RepID=UPI002118E618|nr:uncharacterized protein LOC126188797 [Schistocerca cancellata]